MLPPTKDGPMRWNSRFSHQIAGLALVFALLILLPSLASAKSSKIRDWNDAQDPMQSAIGLHYGKMGGNGLSFRVPVEWWLYVQVGGGIWYNSDDERHNLGLELHYVLRQDDRLRLFLGTGLGYFHHAELKSRSGDNEKWETTNNTNFGAGVGLEYLLGVRWALQFELDFVHTGENGDIKVAPQLGVHYYW